MNALPHHIPSATELPPRARDYLDAVAQACTRNGQGWVSLVLFGSTARGGFDRQVSDVDLFVVLPDDASREQRALVSGEVGRLESEHGFGRRGKPRHALEALAERVCGNYLSCFVCTRSDLLSGDVARVFDLNAAEALFVDRIVLANIIASAVTVWGEDLVPQVRLPPVRRLDVWKACFNFISQLQLSLFVYPLLPDATRYAMGTLKHSVHSCFFCYHGRTAALEEEVAFFRQRLGAGAASRTLHRLLDLRGQYRKSFPFVLSCLPTLLRLHLRTALDNRFPLQAFPPKV